MPELLLELFSEEIPARMQAQAAKDLERLVVGALSDRGLLFEGAKSFAGPRRLTLAIAGLPAKQPDVKEEKKGPRVGANEKAIEGFLKSAGVTLDQCAKQSDAKGEFYVAVIERKGRATADVLAEILPEAMAKLPWPKSMRWGQESKERGTARWVRPLHAIVATFDGEIVPFIFAGVASGNATRGHRFLSDGAPITVRRLDDYIDKLRAAHVVVDAAERRETILHEAKQRSFALGLELVDDEGLLNEVTGLAEWPVVLVGTIDSAFMDLPPEILQTSMRAHQKYFALRGQDGKLANKFVVVANMVADDGGKEIVAGNERVLRARLSDAKFFWDQDRKRTLDSRVADLKDIVFHAKLGTQLERVQRIQALSESIARNVMNLDDYDIENVVRAAHLCKADLTTDVVREFPELQGLIGCRYAIENGEDEAVAIAIADHYKPAGAQDALPSQAVGAAVALADKIDALVGLFFAGERPSGSRDPFALRRSALGIIRILDTISNEDGTKLDFPLPYTFAMLAGLLSGQAAAREKDRLVSELRNLFESSDWSKNDLLEQQFKRSIAEQEDASLRKSLTLAEDIYLFVWGRIKSLAREEGFTADLIEAVYWSSSGRIAQVRPRLGDLRTFLRSDDGTNLLTGYRRAANILKIEEKKDKTEYRGAPDAGALKQDEEKELAAALASARDAAAKALQKEDFAAAMSALAKLRAPVDRFFDKVTVNADDKALRENRLKLLSQIVDTAHQVADFSKIEG